MFSTDDIRILRALAVITGGFACAMLLLVPDAIAVVLSLAAMMMIVPIGGIYLWRRLRQKQKSGNAPEHGHS